MRIKGIISIKSVLGKFFLLPPPPHQQQQQRTYDCLLEENCLFLSREEMFFHSIYAIDIVIVVVVGIYKSFRNSIQLPFSFKFLLKMLQPVLLRQIQFPVSLVHFSM